MISGPSGAGKGTVLEEVFKRVDGLYFSVSATTRGPRKGEENGINYHFITDEKFDELIQNDGMLEYVSKYGNRYGTVKDEVKRLLSQCKDVVLEIETIGASNVKRLLPDIAVNIFIAPPSLKELRARLDARQTEDETNKALRFNTSVAEMECAYDYDYIVINDCLQTCVDKVVGIIESERCKVRYNKHLIEQITDEG